MMLKFNADETFAMAQQLETNANTFYRHAASLAKTATSAAFFEELAKWELTHLDIFTHMRDALTAQQKEQLVFDPQSETGLYLKAIADGHVFDMRKDIHDVIKGTESVAEIIRIALKMERDSIIFYLGVKEVIDQEAGKNKVNDIIHEEMRHIAFLNRELTAMQ